MRIGLFSDSYYPEINGVANSVYTLYTQLTATGHDVHVFAPRCKGYQAHESDHVHYLKSIPLLVLKDRNIALYTPNFFQKIVKYNFDVIHTNSEFFAGHLGRRVAARTPNCVLVHTYHTAWEEYVDYITHGFGDEKARAFARKYSRFWCNRCDHVVAPSHKTRRLLEEYGVIRPIRVIPSGLEVARFAPALHPHAERMETRAECGVAPSERVLLNLGRISKEKNLDQVIRIFPRLLRLTPDIRLVIVGEGPAVESLRAQAQTLGCVDSVTFTGPKPWDKIDKYYAMGDVFVSTSHSETQGLTYIEAMASGLCVVAYDDPCLEGVVYDGENGLLVPDDDEALLNALVRAFSQEGASIAQRAPRSVAHYSPDAFAQHIEQLYTQALSAKRA